MFSTGLAVKLGFPKVEQTRKTPMVEAKGRVKWALLIEVSLMA
jgi:hypothetical protein